MAPFRSFHSSSPFQMPTGEKRKKLLGLVDIYHPGYPNSNPLLSLNASDDGGIHYTVVYYACCIVAGNVWKPNEGRGRDEKEPFLSLTRKPKAIIIPDDDILRNRRYYFHVPNSKYPDSAEETVGDENVKLPDAPPRESPPPAVMCHTEACRITGHLNGLDLAHIIPEVSESWFRANFMREYSSSNTMHNDPLNHSPNIMPLRTDLHRFLDRSQLTLVPKPNPKAGSTTTRSYTLVSHVHRPSGKSNEANLEMIMFYHDLKVYTLIGNPIEYIFARFAWSLFDDTIMLLFHLKDTKNPKFLVIISEESEDSQERTQIYQEFKGNPPLPRSRTREKRYVTKHPLPDIGDDIDDINDTESINSFDPASYDAAFDDIHRKHSRSSSPNNSKYTNYNLDLNNGHCPISTEQPTSHTSTNSSNNEREPLTEPSPESQSIGNNNVSSCSRIGLIKNIYIYGFYNAKRLGSQYKYSGTLGRRF
ncbi:hypothetical protein F4814DRAFT_438304 [Daldinia grandis]|nr:hypothetical protein F4814DRAFT_438304 [Daldinia grandis]